MDIESICSRRVIGLDHDELPAGFPQMIRLGLLHEFQSRGRLAAPRRPVPHVPATGTAAWPGMGAVAPAPTRQA